ncbi:MAG: hypothetical protein ACK5KU_09770 [Beutenbergiaceae bacterium]
MMRDLFNADMARDLAAPAKGEGPIGADQQQTGPRTADHGFSG